jgi:hypothetical protein
VGLNGAPTRFPIAELTYTDNTSLYHGFREPVEAVVIPNDPPAWKFESPKAFPTITEYTDFVSSQYSASSPPRGSNGVFSLDYRTVFNEFYQGGKDQAFSVARASYVLLGLSLAPDPITHRWTAISIERFARQQIESLPPNYSGTTNQNLFDDFFSKYGVSMMTSVTMGGRLEQYTQWDTPLTTLGFSTSKLEKVSGVQVQPVYKVF